MTTAMRRRLAAIERLLARPGSAKSDRSGSAKSDRSGSAKSDRSGSARSDRSGSARTARKNERDAKQRAAAAASGQALPVQLQRLGRRQKVSGLLPLSGDEADSDRKDHTDGAIGNRQAGTVAGASSLTSTARRGPVDGTSPSPYRSRRSASTT
jgi:hypothetical protein